jgi:Tetracyclin repressor-like, C-terminal domain
MNYPARTRPDSDEARASWRWRSRNWAIIRAHIDRMVTIVEAIIRGDVEAGEFAVDDAAEAARAVKSSFTPFFHPILIEHCVQHREDMEAGLRDQIRFILKALRRSY